MYMDNHDRTPRVVATSLGSLRQRSLVGVSVLSPNDVWAVGANLLARYSR